MEHVSPDTETTDSPNASRVSSSIPGGRAGGIASKSESQVQPVGCLPFGTWVIEPGRMKSFSGMVQCVRGRIAAPGDGMASGLQPRCRWIVGFDEKYSSIPLPAWTCCFESSSHHQPPVTMCLNLSMLLVVMAISRLGAWWFESTLHARKI